jgi:hypothetical protein
MSESPQPQPPSDDELREIPKWTERYARNRVLPTLVFLCALALYVLAFRALGEAMRRAHRAYQPGLCTLYGLLYLSLMAAWAGFGLWFASRARAIQRAVYRRDGEVEPAKVDVRKVGWFVGAMLLAAVMMFAISVSGTEMTERYIQPLFALVFVPAMVYGFYRVYGRSAPMMYLVPALVALQAILVVAGVPIPGIADEFWGLFVLPFAYMALAVVASHIYGRYALRRLRRLAHAPEANGSGGDAHA